MDRNTENVFQIDENGVLTRYTGQDTEIVLPDTAKVIGRRAFCRVSGYGAVQKMIVPEGVTEIQEYAFDFSGIREIVLPSTLRKIGRNAFSNCRKLRTVAIPEGVTEIADFAFQYSDLEEIVLPESLKEIGRGAFLFCKKLKKVDLPQSESLHIGNSAFLGCYGLADGSGFVIVQNRIYDYCPDHEEEIPEILIPDDVIAVDEDVFTDFEYIDINMPVNCPYWPVTEKSENHRGPRSIVINSDSTLLFRNTEGKIIAKAVLATYFERAPVIDAFILSMRRKETGVFDFEAYDSMFARLDNEYNKAQMALARLQYPYELTPAMEETYTACLRKNCAETCTLLIDMNDMAALRVLENRKIIRGEVIPKLLKYAREKEKYEFIIELMNYQEREFGKKDVYQTLQLAESDSGEDSPEGSDTE
ncbi:MAG: leucine-rich repeat protein [Solobacterium sp.]|nr:leucine-rich repeat protein [Solobacterium sp.]